MPDSFRVIVTGDRHWYCEELAYRVVQGLRAKHGPGVVIVEGGAEGVDWAFHVAANGCEVATERFDADWKRLGPRAGPARNAAMIVAGADLCIAVHPNIDVSRGTKDCVRQALAAGIPTWLIESDDPRCKPIRLGTADVARTEADDEDEAREEAEAEVAAKVAAELAANARAEAAKAEGPTTTEAFDALREKGALVVEDLAKAKAAKAPPPVNLYDAIEKAVQRANSGWSADHPDAPEAVRVEEVVWHLGTYAKNAKMHKLDLMKCDHDTLMSTLSEIAKVKYKRAMIERELRAFVAKAVAAAEERSKPRRTRGPR